MHEILKMQGFFNSIKKSNSFFSKLQYYEKGKVITSHITLHYFENVEKTSRRCDILPTSIQISGLGVDGLC